MGISIVREDDKNYLHPNASALPPYLLQYFAEDTDPSQFRIEEKFDTLYGNFFLAVCAVYDQAYPVVISVDETGHEVYRGPVYGAYTSTRQQLISHNVPQMQVLEWNNHQGFPSPKTVMRPADRRHKYSLFHDGANVYRNIFNHELLAAFLGGVGPYINNYFKLLEENNVKPGSTMWNYVCGLYAARAARSVALRGITNRITNIKTGVKISLDNLEPLIRDTLTKSMPHRYCAFEIGKALKILEPNLFYTTEQSSVLQISTLWSTLTYSIGKLDKKVQSMLVQQLTTQQYDEATLVLKGLFDADKELFPNFVVEILGLKNENEELPF